MYIIHLYFHIYLFINVFILKKTAQQCNFFWRKLGFFFPMRNILIYDNEVVMGLTSNEAWSLIMPDNLTCHVKMWISSCETWWIKHSPAWPMRRFRCLSACQKLICRCQVVYEEMNVNIFPSDHILLFSKPTQTAWHYIILCLQICFHVTFFFARK